MSKDLYAHESGKINLESEVNVNNSSGVTVGDNSTQVNNFGSEPSQTQNSQVTQKKTNFDNFDNFDDDIPF